jgi:hypothetical protein
MIVKHAFHSAKGEPLDATLVKPSNWNDDHVVTDVFSPYTNVMDYGAVGDGLTDDTAAIQDALDVGGTVFFPAGDYLITTNLILHDGNRLIGDHGLSRILVDNTFIASEDTGFGGAHAYSALINEHNSLLYDEDTADDIEIHDLVLQRTQTTNTVYGFGCWANIKHFVVDSCHIITDGRVAGHGMDFYAGCKNVTITNNHFENLNGSSVGSCMLIKNQCSDTYAATTVSENFQIIGNIFESDASDEVLAIYSRDGLMRNVVFTGNEVIGIVQDAWLPDTAYALYDLCVNEGHRYRCITAGTSAGSGGPTSTDEDITDNTCHWKYVAGVCLSAFSIYAGENQVDSAYPHLKNVNVSGNNFIFGSVSYACIKFGRANVIWDNLHAYTLNYIVTNDNEVYKCTQAGTSGDTGGPTGTGSGISDGSCLWDHIDQNMGYMEEVAFTGNTVIGATSTNSSSNICVFVPTQLYRALSVANNVFRNAGAVEFDYSLRALPQAMNNSLYGPFQNGIAYCGMAVGNRLYGDNSLCISGVLDTVYVANNRIYGYKYGVQCYQTGNYLVQGNHITVSDLTSARGIYGNAASTSPVVHAVGNLIDSPNASSYHLYNNSGVMSAVGNIIVGAGAFTHGTYDPDYKSGNVDETGLEQ